MTRTAHPLLALTLFLTLPASAQPTPPTRKTPDATPRTSPGVVVPAGKPGARPAAAAKNNQPRILLGVDAQSPATFDKVAAIGANCLIRYDNGPQKNIPLQDWMDEARKRNLFYIVQGARLFAPEHKAQLPDPFLLAVAQDDEPDLARGGERDPAWQITEGRDAGRTKPEVLELRYAEWKKAAPDVPVIVNFAGQNITNIWYVNGASHKPYINAADWISFDWYVFNNNATRYRIGFLGQTMGKLAGWSGPARKQFCYIECSDQELDGDPAGGIGRGPTPNEITSQIWHALAHGAQGVWLFPQKIRGGFEYWNITPEGEAAIKDAFATITRNQALIADGTRTLKEEFPTDGKTDTKWPDWEEVTWTGKDGRQKLTVHIDLTGEKAPVVK